MSRVVHEAAGYRAYQAAGDWMWEHGYRPVPGSSRWTAPDGRTARLRETRSGWSVEVEETLERNMAKRRHSKKRSSKRTSKRNSRRGVRRNGARRLKRNPSTLGWLALAGAGYLGYRWWQGRQHAAPVALAPSAPPPVVAQPTPPPAVSGLGSLIVM